MKQIKRLPRNEDGSISNKFPANGQKYTIRTAEDGIGVFRFSKLNQFGVIVGGNITFAEYLEFLSDISELQLIDEPAKVIKARTIEKCALQKQKVQQFDQSRYEAALYMATIFIVREGEDLSTWNQTLAKQKIDDWNKEGYHEDDFFVLALANVPGFSNAYKAENLRMTQVIKTMTEKK